MWRRQLRSDRAAGVNVAARLCAALVFLTLVGAGVAPSPAAASCAEVTVIGVRGSGQGANDSGGLGPEVAAVSDRLAEDLAPSSVSAIPVTYSAAAVGELLPTRLAQLAVAAAWTAGKHRLAVELLVDDNRFIASISEGIAKTVDLVNSTVTECPETQVVLVGYSQGAIAVHRAELALAPAVAAHIAGTALIADGDRTSHPTVAKKLGTAHSNAVGVRPYLYEFDSDDVRALPPPAAVAQPSTTVEICNKYDIVCDFGLLADITHKKKAEMVHTRSYLADHADILKVAADWLASLIKKDRYSLAGEWFSETGGGHYVFTQTGPNAYSGYVVNGGCASMAGDIMDTEDSNGYYTGMENAFSSSSPCIVAGTAANTIRVSADGRTAEWESTGCSDCGPQSWVRESYG